MPKIKKIKFIEPKIKEIKELKHSESDELEDKIDTKGFESIHPPSQEEIDPSLKPTGNFQQERVRVREISNIDTEDERQARANYFQQTTRSYEQGGIARPRRNNYNPSIEPAGTFAGTTQAPTADFVNNRIPGQHQLGQGEQIVGQREIGDQRDNYEESRKRRAVHEGG